MGKERSYVGIDVSKATLDMAVYSSPEKWQFANDDAGINRVTEFLGEIAPALVVMEATGRVRDSIGLRPEGGRNPMRCGESQRSEGLC
jgi:hypothetical protein